MSQFIVIHTWPDNSASVMPDVFSSEVAAGIHRDHCQAIEHDRPGHVYTVATVSSLLHVTKSAPRPEPGKAARKVLTDEEVSALAAV